MSSLGIVIMAGGRGTRLKSTRPKVLHTVGGKPLLQHVIDAALTLAAPCDIHVVVGHQAELVQQAVSSTAVNFVLQPQQLGTGHALQMVKAAFLTSGITPPDNLMVLSGDVPLIRPETLSMLWKTHLREQASMTILTAIPPNPTGYGRVLRQVAGGPAVSAIIEQKSLTSEQLAQPALIREINSGIYVFHSTALFHCLDELKNDNSAGEFYLTDVAALLVNEGDPVVAVAADSVDEVLGANTIAEMMHLDSSMRHTKTHQLMANGVTIFQPDTVVIDANVSVGPDTILEPFTQLLGNTVVGSGSHIRSYSVVQDSTLGNNVLVRNGCILDHATVGDGALLGPYAHLRPDSQIGKGAHVGNFVETKKTVLGAGSKANHLSYLGDALIGERVNIGAGVITCNYDGVNKTITTIGDDAFVGSDSTLVAPVTLGNGSYVAAGSCITQNLPPDSLGIGRSRQSIKEGWALSRRAAAKKKTSPAT